jgi:hypothetical protein
MDSMIVLRLEGQSNFLLIDPASGTVRQIEPGDAPAHEAAAEETPKYRGVAEAYALPALPNIPSRKFYRS